MATATEKRDQLRKLMKGIDIAMFTTYGEGGFPVSRPLSTQEAEFDGSVLWFFARRSSGKVAEIERNPKVNVAYASKEKNVYLSVAGTAQVVDEQAMIDAFWNDAMKAFFARGRTDPDLVLLKVSVHTVEYWDGPSTLLGKAIAFVVARVRKDDAAMGDSGQIRMPSSRSAPRRAPAKRVGTKAGAARKATAKRARTATRMADGRKVAGDGPAAARKGSPGKAAAGRPAARKAAPKRVATKKTAAGKTADRARRA